MQRKLISSESSFEKEVAYSRAVVLNDWIFVSGTTGYDYTNMTIAESIEEQTEQCIKNIEQALQDANASLKDIVRVNYIVPQAKEFPKCWEILRKYFGEIRPAATMISANLLNEKIKIEIEVTAIRS